MRGLILFLPALLIAQAPAPKPQTAGTPPAAKQGAVTGAPAKSATPRPAVTAPKPAGPPPLTTDDQKAIYALGLSMARSLSQFDLSPAELDIVKRAITDSVAGKPAIELNEWGPKIQALATARGGRVAAREKAASAAYLAKAAAEPGAAKTESGMIYRELRP